MNWVELLLILLAVQAIVSGARRGLVIAVLSFLCLLAGAALGLQLAPVLLDSVQDSEIKVVLAFTFVVVLALAGEGIGLRAGLRVRYTIAVVRLSGVDNALGAVLHGAALLVVAWLVALPLTAAAALPGLASAVTNSRVLNAVNSVMPAEARKLPGELRTMLGESGFPDVM